MDANGELLYYNVVRGGSQIEIEGRRPYSLVVGNAAAVKVSFEGNPIDLASISERGVARFRLGAE
jgi:cytoskeleton protein RodZ